MSKQLAKLWSESLIREAIEDLRKARNRLRSAGAPKAADYVARAMKSAEGAQRYCRNKRYTKVATIERLHP